MKKYLIIDTQNLGYRNFKITPKSSPIDDRIGLTFHNIITQASNAFQLYEADHCIFCFDSSSWRKIIYPEYKGNRVTAKNKMSPSEQKADAAFLKALMEFKEFLTEKTNTSVLHCDGLEADDLIAGWCERHQDDMNVIISNDSDFVQLVSNNVHIYNGSHYLKPEGAFDQKNRLDESHKYKANHDWEYELFKKCIRGDSSDNIFSAYPRVREKGTKNMVGIREAYEDRINKGFKWNSFMNSTWVDHNKKTRIVKEEYEKNKALIDLKMIPEEIQQLIDITIQEQLKTEKTGNTGLSFIQFCKKWQLNRILNEAQKIGVMLNRHYEKT